MSDDYLAETARIQSGILELLDGYPVGKLSEEQRLCAGVMRWQLDDALRLHEYRYSSFTVSHFTVAEPAATELFFTDVQPVDSLRNAENYITRLEQVGTKFGQLADGIRIRQQYGTVLPVLSSRWLLGSLREISTAAADANPYYTTFRDRLAALDIDEAEAKQLLARALAASESSVIAGYRELEAALLEQRQVQDGNRGAWSLPDGASYYRTALRHHTTTEMTPSEIHERGYAELERIHAEMRGYFDEIGIDSAGSIAEMYRELDRGAERVAGSEVVEGYTSILREAENIAPQLFHRLPEARVVVKGAETGGFYMPASIDGSRPGMFFASESGGLRYKMPTLTFHETVPGHHLQQALANELPLSPWQKGIGFLGYVEGWALYAERLMADFGYYDGDPAGQLGRLQAEAHRAARLVMDTGLNSFEWDFDRAVRFFVENTGYGEGYGTWEALRYIVWPGQAAAYMTGLLAILDMREQYRSTAGEDRDIRDFHALLLEQGAAPLSLLNERMELHR